MGQFLVSSGDDGSKLFNCVYGRCACFLLLWPRRFGGLGFEPQLLVHGRLDTTPNQQNTKPQIQTTNKRGFNPACSKLSSFLVGETLQGECYRHRHTDIKTRRHTDTQTDRHTNTQTQAHRHTDTQTHLRHLQVCKGVCCIFSSTALLSMVRPPNLGLVGMVNGHRPFFWGS